MSKNKSKFITTAEYLCVNAAKILRYWFWWQWYWWWWRSWPPKNWRQISAKNIVYTLEIRYSEKYRKIKSESERARKIENAHASMKAFQIVLYLQWIWRAAQRLTTSRKTKPQQQHTHALTHTKGQVRSGRQHF